MVKPELIFYLDNARVDDPDKKLVKFLGAQHISLFRKYKLGTSHPISIHLFTQKRLFHSEICRISGNHISDVPDWIIGTSIKDSCFLLKSKKIDEHEFAFFKTILHETIHIIIRRHYLERPFIWLDEGLAVLESGQFDDLMLQRVLGHVKSNTLPKINDLNTKQFVRLGGYHLAASLMIFFNDYFQKGISIIEHLCQMKEVDFDALTPMWHEYLQVDFTALKTKDYAVEPI